MYFFVRTSNPRPTFHLDMTAEERATMTQHVAFWTEKAGRGQAPVFGPVADPAGMYGILIANVADEGELKSLLARDPARDLWTYSYWPMANAVTERMASAH